MDYPHVQTGCPHHDFVRSHHDGGVTVGLLGVQLRQHVREGVEVLEIVARGVVGSVADGLDVPARFYGLGVWVEVWVLVRWCCWCC